MSKKGSRVTQQEAKKMWELYQVCGSVVAVARTMKRDRGTVSRHIAAYEASVNTASVILAAKGQSRNKGTRKKLRVPFLFSISLS